MTKNLIDCTTISITGYGRTRNYFERATNKTTERAIPSDFKVPTCTKCGKMFFDTELQRSLDKIILPHAASVYVINSDGKILAVSRKDDPTDFGLPGGKVEPGESDEEAAIREAKEETGITVFNLHKMIEETDDNEYYTTCYRADYEGEPRDMGQGVVRWITRKELFKGTFSNFYKKMLYSR